MATHHAIAGEPVDLATWGQEITPEHSKAITKIHGLELAKLILQAGEDMHPHGYCNVAGPIVIHCIHGKIRVRTRDIAETLTDGQLLYLEGGTDHALTGVVKSVVLLTIVLI